jgi:hypothetical protein
MVWEVNLVAEAEEGVWRRWIGVGSGPGAAFLSRSFWAPGARAV